MNEVVVHRLAFGFDRARQALVFTGTLENGYQFSVAFPIAHVAVTFDNHMSELGYCGSPIMGGEIVTLDGFFSKLKHLVSAPVKFVEHATVAPFKAVLPHTVQNALNKTINKVGQQAVHFGRGAASFVAKETFVPFKAVSDIARGKNVFQSLQGVARQAQIAASFVPGVGTLASMGIGGITGAIQGKSLTDIAKLVAAGAVPGGPLVVAAAQTAINMGAAGIEGKNMLTAARNELIRGAASMIPDPHLQQVVAQAALAAASGQNVLRGAQSALLNTALAQLPDVGARGALQAALSGAHVAHIMQAAGPHLLTRVAAMPGSSTGHIISGVVHAATKAGAPGLHGPFGFSVAHYFPAISAHGLASYHVASIMAKNPAQYRTKMLAMSRSNHPSAQLLLAGLRSVRV